MSVSVVVPLFNGLPWIRDALHSVREQALAPEEIVVVDDGSTDGSPSVVQAFDGVRLVANDTKGGAAARNLGVRLTSARRVAFLDQDDVWHHDHLRTLSAALNQNPDAPAAVAGSLPFSGDDRPRLRASPRECWPLDVWALFPVACPIPTPSTVLVRRTALEQAGGFDNSLRGIDDYLLWLRLATNRPFVRVAAPTVGWRIHDASEGAGLRRSGLDYLELHRQAAHAAVKQDLGERARRCLAFDAAADMTRAVTDGDKERATQAARDFEERVADDTDAFIEAVFEQLVWILCCGSRRRRFDLLASYNAILPPEAKRTRRVLASGRKLLGFAVRGHVRKAGFVLSLLSHRLLRD